MLGVAAYLWMQFAGSVATLEYHIYSSMLWAGVCLSTAFLIVGMSDRLLTRPATAAVPAGLMLAAAVGWGLARADVHVTLAPAGLLIAAALVVLGVSGVIARRHRGLAGLAVAGVVVADLVLTAAPTGRPALAGTTVLPHGHYDTILGHPHARTSGRRPAVSPTSPTLLAVFAALAVLTALVAAGAGLVAVSRRSTSATSASGCVPRSLPRSRRR